MRTAKLQLTAAVVASAGLLGLAGAGTYTVLAQDKGPAPKAGTVPPAPPAPPKADPAAGQEDPATVTAFPALDPKSLEDLVANCPNLFGGKDVPIGPTDDPLVRLKKARLNAVVAEFRLLRQRLEAGQYAVVDMNRAVLDAAGRAAAAAADLYGRDLRSARPWAVERVRVAKWCERVAAARAAAAADPADVLPRARYARLDAEVSLLKLDEEAKRPNY